MRNTNDLGGGLDRIAEESRVFYLLGFYPPEGKSEREWRKLKVEVKRPGLTVRARRGYTLRLPGPAKPEKKDKKKDKDKAPRVDPAILRALDSAHPVAGLPLRAMSYVLEPRPNDLTHVVLAAEVNADPAEALATRGRARRAARRVASWPSIATAAEASATTMPWRSSPRSPGLRAGARSPASSSCPKASRRCASWCAMRPAERWDRSRSASRFLRQAGCACRRPVLTDRIEKPTEPGEKPRAALAVHRVFVPAGALYCQFEVFGATLAGAGAARVNAGLELRSADGQVIRHGDLTPIAVDANGRIVRLVGLGLDGLQEGPYELLLQVVDQVSGVSLERREPFVLAREGSR